MESKEAKLFQVISIKRKSFYKVLIEKSGIKKLSNVNYYMSFLLLCVILLHHPVCVSVLYLMCVYVVASSTKVHPIHFIYQSPSHSSHLQKSLSCISSTIVHHLHIYHIWSCLLLHCHSVLLSQYIKKHDFAEIYSFIN